MTYVQCYNPAIHVHRRGLSDISLFTWLMLGGEAMAKSECSVMRSIHGVEDRFFGSINAFLANIVCDPALRVEAVLSGRGSTEMLRLLPTYEARMFGSLWRVSREDGSVLAKVCRRRCW